VLSPDRLARNDVHQMVRTSFIEELEKNACRMEFMERPMSSEPDDQLQFQIRGAVAEYERTLLSERRRRGKLAKYKAGLLLPWTHTPTATGWTRTGPATWPGKTRRDQGRGGRGDLRDLPRRRREPVRRLPTPGVPGVPAPRGGKV
jgi:Resolvase, N terminal domain